MRREQILKLMALTLSDFDDNIKSIVENIRSSLGKFSELMPLSPEDKAKEEQAIEKVGAALREKKDELINAVVALYEGTFTAEEVDAIVAFNESPPGVKLREKSPGLQETMWTAVQAWQGPILEGLNDELQHLLGTINAGAPLEGKPAEEIDFMGDSPFETAPQIEIDPSRQVKFERDEPKEG